MLWSQTTYKRHTICYVFFVSFSSKDHKFHSQGTFEFPKISLSFLSRSSSVFLVSSDIDPSLKQLVCEGLSFIYFFALLLHFLWLPSEVSPNEMPRHCPESKTAKCCFSSPTHSGQRPNPTSASLFGAKAINVYVCRSEYFTPF